MIPLHSLVRFHRHQAGLSQRELAEIADVGRYVVQAIESGEEGIQWRNICVILEVLNVSFEPSGPLVTAWRETLEKDRELDEE